jgi:hypothetical protein
MRFVEYRSRHSGKWLRNGISYLTGISMDNIFLGGLLLFPIQITADFLCWKSTALLFIAKKVDEEERPRTY